MRNNRKKQLKSNRIFLFFILGLFLYTVM
ncbi:SVM family protein [candidate division KSB1 bacterium]|nr:SVM family protein [candidate division KSB1 bacterium]